MYPVSNDYKTQINKTLRNLSFIKVTINMADPDIVDTNTTTDNGHLSFSDSSATDLGTSAIKTYATFEHNRLVLNGTQSFPPESGDLLDFYQGFVSSQISDSNGNFTSPYPTISTTFNDYTSFVGLSFKFDEIMGCYPTEMEIVAYDNGVEIERTTHNPYDITYITPLGVPTNGNLCNRIDIIFKKMSVPKRRARLSYMIFGLMKEWTDKTITSATWNRSVDLVSSKLPVNSFEFTSIDLNPNTGLPEYNPDNPVGLWQYIEQLQPVSVTYGYELDSGDIEWIDGADLFTTGEMKSDSSGAISTITFYATSILTQLTNVYYKGKYNATPVTLYSLAQDVFQFANLKMLSNGGQPYYIDTALQSIYTSCPIPELPINQALQLIANAGRCVLYVDRNGQIRMERFTDVLEDFELNFSNMTSIPVVSKAPTLKTVTTSYTDIESSLTTESLSKASLSFTTPTECRITYSDAVGQSVVTSGTLTVIGSPAYYANSCVVTLNGTGDIEVFGKKLIRSTNGVVYSVANAGYDCPMENPLINNYADAVSYATWIANIVKLRNQYTVDDRGYPEFDVLDVIYTQSLFSNNLQSIITENKLTFNGTLSATTTYISKEVV